MITNRKTKIIATIGPSSEPEKVLEKLLVSDYSYYINGRHNRIFSRILNSKRPASEQDINLLKQELTRRYIDIAKEIVNYYGIT